jgi:hypothetical protein
VTTKEHFESIDARLGVIEGQLGVSENTLPKNSFWPKTLTEWMEIIGVSLTMLSAACAVGLYLGSLMVDKHIQSAIKPIQDDVQQTKGDLREIKGMLIVLKSQIAVVKYSSIPSQELKKHHDELASIKTTLASAKQDAPNYWQISFQIITLLSQAQATSVLEAASKKPLKILDNVAPPGGPGTPILMTVTNDNVLLKNLVANEAFIGSVIHLDPSVRLVNDVFQNCVFIFPSEENPPKNLQQIGSELLAADLSNVTVKGS